MALVTASPDDANQGQRALHDAVEAQDFCQGYTAAGDAQHGPISFTCECGELSGAYPDYKTANTVLDTHLEAQQDARGEFIEQWRAREVATQPPTPV